MHTKQALIFLLCLCISACVGTTVKSDLSEAENALIHFFSYLSNGEYEEATGLYGGDYDNLQAMNPDVPPDDREALWKNACRVNGFQCLPVSRVAEAERITPVEFLFTVEFTALNGERFELNPCCGMDEGELTVVTQFQYHVDLVSGIYLVREMPIYVP